MDQPSILKSTSDIEPQPGDRIEPARPSPIPRRPRAERWKQAKGTKGAVGVVVAIGLWESLRFAGLLGLQQIPSIPKIYSTVFEGFRSDSLGPAVGSTMKSALLGLTVATVLAVPAGMFIGINRTADRMTRTFFELIRPVPSIAFIPVAIIVLGLGVKTLVFVVAFACFWPVLFNTKAGVEDVDGLLVETGRVLGIRGARILTQILLPSALPSIATGFRIAASTALVVTITGEIMIGRSGIGYYMESSRIVGKVDKVWAAAVTAGLIGYLMSVGLLRLERSKLAWSAGHQGE